MKNESTPCPKAHLQSAFFSLRALLALLVCTAVACSMVSGALLAFFRPEAPGTTSHPAGAGLTFAERVGYQRAIEEVYWRHRIWPRNRGERPDPKPSLDEVVPPQQLEKKVAEYLRSSQALEDYWQKPISAEQLQAEMERMAKHTKQPEVLRELFEALGNDPLVIAECLARPALSERLVTNFYAHDQRFHGELRQRAEADLRTHRSLEQMKQTSGNYSEIELVRSDSARDEDNRDAEPGLKMNSREWDENLQKLAAMFGSAKNDKAPPQLAHPGRRGDCGGGAQLSHIKTGVLSSLQEDEERYYATAVVKKTKDRLKLATVEWRKEPLESWRTRAENQMPKVAAAANANYTLPAILDGAKGCADDTWATTSNLPVGRLHHTAVWTGSEMIVWGGADSHGSLTTGGRYNPSTDSWLATSTTNAPTARFYYTAVWTGTEMIIWGGNDGSSSLNTGGRYNPGTDSWTATTTNNAPAGRYYHTGVWTGTEMIVWGGYNDNFLNTGGRYNPGTDSWTATSSTNAPAARYLHTGVWTGTEMIVWGGYNDNFLNTGGRYNPGTDSWTATSTTKAPAGREYHTAVWTGSEMIIWGGYFYNGGQQFLNTGGRYNPSTDTWATTGTASAPTPRENHTVAWTGSEMIVWAGDNGSSSLNTGGRYNPSMDSWTATSTANAPAARDLHTAIWTGSEMIVWGGQELFVGDLNTGGRYNPSMDSWTATSTANMSTARDLHTAIWTGTEMIVWGGYDGSSSLNTGGRYNPSTNSWTATSTTNAPTGRYLHTAVWTGTEMIIWGGGPFLSTGGRYNPGTDSWTATSTTNAPAGRDYHTAVWSGSEMIVWGGYASSTVLNTGGRYNPSTDSWTATSTANAPAGRELHTAVWTGSEMIVWGGDDLSVYLNTGGRYNPDTDSWTATSTVNAPVGREYHTAMWTGGEMIVWGGAPITNTGGRYNPGTNNWTATGTTNAPSARFHHTAVWTGSEMIVWGGAPISNTGGRYNPGADSWTATSTASVPTPREYHTAVWTGSEMIVWAGLDIFVGYVNTGGRYCAQSQAPMAQGAFSRKTHGAAGTFDIPLPLSGNVGVECRSGGATNDYQMIIDFPSSVTVGSASLTSGTGNVSSLSGSETSQITVNLTGVINVQRITVTLFNVNDGTHIGNVPVSMGVLVGDANGNAAVNASDVALTKSQLSMAVSSSNFREDVNANGSISSTDVVILKSDVGTSLPP